MTYLTITGMLLTAFYVLYGLLDIQHRPKYRIKSYEASGSPLECYFFFGDPGKYRNDYYRLKRDTRECNIERYNIK